MSVSLRALCLAMGTLILLAACDENPPTGPAPDNLPPRAPQLVAPTRGVAVPGEPLWLQWKCEDPEGDPLSYDVYFGSGPYPGFYAHVGPLNRFCVIPAPEDSVYRWAVVAKDPQGRQIPSVVRTIKVGDAFRYPLMHGYMWTYSGRSWYTNIRGTDWSPPDTQFVVDVVQDSSLQFNSVDISRLHETTEYSTIPGDDHQSDGADYMVNSPDGLLYLGYDGQTLVGPIKSPGATTLQVGNIRVSDIEELHAVLLGRKNVSGKNAGSPETIFFETPRISLYYPPEVGVQWAYLRPDDNDGAFYADKKYTGMVEVTVPAGTFECYEVRWLYDLDRDGIWDGNVEIRDYICELGLIKRVIAVRDVRISTYDMVYVTLADNISEWELTDVSYGEPAD